MDGFEGMQAVYRRGNKRDGRAGHGAAVCRFSTTGDKTAMLNKVKSLVLTGLFLALLMTIAVLILTIFLLFLIYFFTNLSNMMQ